MKLVRKIPTVMFSQHPDHATIPFWHNHQYVKTHHEVIECYLMFKKLKAEEIMWDWEGKLVDETIVEKLLGKYSNYFQKFVLGEDIFLTFRIPNPRIESGYRLSRALMVIISSYYLSHSLGFTNPPLFEVILPMTETAEEMISLKKGFERISQATFNSFGSGSFLKEEIEIIPLFEDVKTILKSKKILEDYILLCKKYFGKKPSYIRPFCARSDPALNSGIVPTTLSIKWALSEFKKFSEKTGIPIYPIIGPGALPFRGGLSPELWKEFVDEFSGIRTVLIQSSFRYDYPLDKVKIALKKLKKYIPKSETKLIAKKTLKEIQTIIPWFEKPYKQMVEKMVPIINKISTSIPKRRERVQHIGLFGYSRRVGKNKLPRAIGFTASCYSLGIPPEFFGLSQGLKKIRKQKKLFLLESHYKLFKPSLIRAGRYLRKESFKDLRLEFMEKEIDYIEKFLGEKLGPKTTEEKKHAKVVGQVIARLKSGKTLQKKIEQAALLRHSLG
ncbi:MAG: phosphoenolpyruvate carboxylase [Exilispira sp.]|nr:phosphoenolpyruvate carboxylase [Exilispira sp.]